MAKTSAPATVADLLDLVLKSGLVPDAERPAVEAAARRHSDPAEFARQLVQDHVLSSWQAAQLLSGQFVLRLSHFELLNEAGAWEFGRAFVARDVRTGEQVTFKLLANRLLASEGVWQRCQNEIRTSSALRAAGLIPFKEIGRSAQRSFLIAPLDQDLDARQAAAQFGAPSAERVARLVEQAAEALAALHAAGLAHGCLRPQRLVFASDGSVRLRDVGLAALAESARQHGEMATADVPEQFTAPPQLPPPRADLYSLGRIGLFLLDTPAPSTAAASPPPWWNEGIRGETATQALRDELARFAALESPAAPADAQEAGERMRAWRLGHAAGQIQEALPVTAGAAPAEPVAAAAQAAAGVEPGAIVIDTRLRRPRPEGTTTPVATRPRQVLLLVVAAASFFASALLIGGYFAWQYWPRSAEPRRVANAPEPARRPDAGDAAAGAETSAAAGAAGDLGSGDDVLFPTADAFEMAPPSANSGEPSARGPAPDDLAKAGDPMPRAAPAAAMPMNDMEPAQPAPGDSRPETDTAEKPAEIASAPAPKTPAPSPEPMPEPPAPAPVPAPTVSLASLPAAVSLPPIADANTAPTVFCSLPVEPPLIVTLSLQGGDRVLRDASLTVENAEGGTAERKWDVLLVESSARTPVARLELDGEELTFRWLGGAAEKPVAGQLANCALRVAVGTEQRDISLREPQIIDPLAIDVVRGSANEKWDIANPPNAADCRLEITGLSDQPLMVIRHPNDSIPASGGQWLLLGESAQNVTMAVYVESEFRRQFELTLTPTLPPDEKLLEPNVPPRVIKQFVGQRDNRVTRANVERWTRATAVQVAEATQRVELLTRQSQAIQGNVPQKQEIERNLNLANLDLERAKARAEQVARIREIWDPEKPAPKLQFRLIFESGNGRVELLRAGQ